MEQFIRRMEPPAHDAIHPAQLRLQGDRKAAEEELQHHRTQIQEHIKNRIDAANLKTADNITELARLFPGMAGPERLEQLQVKERKFTENTGEPAMAEDDEDLNAPTEANGDEPRTGKNGGNDDDGGSHNNDGDPAYNSAEPVYLNRSRIVRRGKKELAMTFVMPNQQGVLRFGLRTAGEQYLGNEEEVRLKGVRNAGDMLTAVNLRENEINVSAPTGTTVQLLIELEEEDTRYSSYRLTSRKVEAPSP